MYKLFLDSCCFSDVLNCVQLRNVCLQTNREWNATNFRHVTPANISTQLRFQVHRDNTSENGVARRRTVESLKMQCASRVRPILIGRCFCFLQNLEERERKHTVHKEHLNREHRYLRRRLEQLTALTMLSKRRSVSECSTSTISSTNSSTFSSETPSCISESGQCRDENALIGLSIHLSISGSP